MSYWPVVKILDFLGNIINPAKEDGNLATIKTNTDKIPSQGQAAMAASTPVVIASNQTAFPVTANAGTNLNTSALALETGGNLAAVKVQTDKLTFDPVSHDLVQNDHPHSEIHDGTNYFYTDAISLGLAGTQDYLITTPNSAVLSHFLFSIDFLFVTQVQIFEAGDRTGTTSQTILNSNRNSVNTSGNTLKKGTSGGTTDGTVIYNYTSGVSVGTGANKITGGGALSGRNEIILKANTKYIVRITSSTAANLINILFDWYEI